MPIGDAPHIIKILEVEIGVTLVIEETMDTMQEVIRDIGIIIMTIGEADRNNYNDYRRNNYRGQGYNRNKNRSLDRQHRSRRRDRSISNGRSTSGSRASTNRNRIRYS